MTIETGVAIPRALVRVMHGLVQELDGRPLRAILYPAGGLARALLREGLPEPIEIIGVADADPGARTIGGFGILPASGLGQLAPEAILVASTRFHEEILLEHGEEWRRLGIRVIDLCAGQGPLSEFEDEAWRLGLELDTADPDLLRITRPGPPAKRIIYRREAWGNTLWMLRDFDHYFAGVIPDRTGPEGAVVNLSRPGYHTLMPSGVRLFYPSMVEHEDLIGQYLDFARLEPGQSVLDLGAYAGDSTYFFARAVGPQGKVVAVEPDPVNLAALRLNVKEHRLAQVAVDGSAILDRDGTVSFQAEGSIGSGIAETSDQKGYEITVPTVTLATLLARHGLDGIHFIKMDIEGAEVRVLAGNTDLLRHLRPRLIIEPHPHQGVSNLAKIMQLLGAMGCATEVQDDLVRAWWP